MRSRLSTTSDLDTPGPGRCATDPDAAQRAVKAIRVGVKILAHQPHVGRPVEDMDAEFREWLIDFGDSGYVTLYRFDSEIVSILAVRHQREAGY